MQLSSPDLMHGNSALDLQGQQWLAANAAAVLDAVVDAIITIDARGNMQSVNKATERLFGYTASELIGQPVTVLMPEPHRSIHQRYVDNYIQSGQAKIIGIGRELEAVTKSGQVFPIYLAVSNVDDGKHFAGIIRDLSAEKAAEKALLEQKERVAQAGRLTTMGEMTASIAHEINQPLTAIAMYAQASLRLLAKQDDYNPKVMQALEKLNDQSIRAGEVIERIQRFVQNAGGARQSVSINDILRDIHKLAAGDARLHGIDLQYDLDAREPSVFCDAVQIQQVTLNLVRNAIDAMFEDACSHGNRIVIGSQVLDGDVVVRVVDQGPGVPDEHATRLFSAFHTTKKDGMGMGLSICKTIIDEHDGQLGFANQQPNGAMFYFRLPVAPEE